MCIHVHVCVSVGVYACTYVSVLSVVIVCLFTLHGHEVHAYVHNCSAHYTHSMNHKKQDLMKQQWHLSQPACHTATHIHSYVPGTFSAPQ